MPAITEIMLYMLVFINCPSDNFNTVNIHPVVSVEKSRAAIEEIRTSKEFKHCRVRGFITKGINL